MENLNSNNQEDKNNKQQSSKNQNLSSNISDKPLLKNIKAETISDSNSFDGSVNINNKLDVPFIKQNNQINIEEDYILNYRVQQTSQIQNTQSMIFNDETPEAFTAGLYNQLLGKERQRSKTYNILLLTIFNMNLAQYTFPYLTIKVGVITMAVCVLLSMGYSFIIQKFILDFLTSYKSECNYGKVVESNLGNFSAYLIEIFSLIWFFTLMLICCNTLESAISFAIDYQYYIDNENLCLIIISVIIFFLFFTMNLINKSYVIDFYVFVCILCQLVSFIVSYLAIMNINAVLIIYDFILIHS